MHWVTYIFLLIYFLGEYYIIYYSCYSTFAYLTQVRWTGIILWHNNVAWNDPLAQLVTLLVTQTIEDERLVAVQSNRWIYWTKIIFLKMERVLPSGSMGCNLVVTSSDNQVPPPPLSFQPPLREPLSSKRTHLPLFSRVKRNIYTFSARLYGFKSLVTISLPDVLFS